MNSQLVALKGKLYSKSFQIEEGQRIVIGRGQDADIQILDTSLSRRHSCLECKDGAFYINDLDSRNGTWVNNRRVARQKLAGGDRVRFGGVKFEFRCEPERRRMRANLIAAFPELPGQEVKEKLNLENSDLMGLRPPFQSMENFKRIQRDLATIYRVGNLISAEAVPERLYERILDAIFEVVQADRAFLLVADADGELQTVAEREKKTLPNVANGTRSSSTIVHECFKEGTAVLRANAMADERYGQAESVIFQNIHSVVCVPVVSPERIVGAIYADTVAESARFAKHDLELLAAVGKQAGMAIHRAKLSEQVHDLLYGTVRALVATIEAKDNYTCGHSERVTAYAVQLGKAMGLSKQDLRTLELGGLLHDVGKIGVPESILRKAGPLTEEEYSVIKQHPKLGHDILSHMGGAEAIAEIVRHHHERWDGRGYPDRIAKDEPSLLARILSVADAFDAMSSKRPYRDRLAQEKVLDEIREGVGTQFDPTIAEALIGEIQSGNISADHTRQAATALPQPSLAPH